MMYDRRGFKVIILICQRFITPPSRPWNRIEMKRKIVKKKKNVIIYTYLPAIYKLYI